MTLAAHRNNVLTTSVRPKMVALSSKQIFSKMHNGCQQVGSVEPVKMGSHGDTSKWSQLRGGRFNEAFYIGKEYSLFWAKLPSIMAALLNEVVAK